MGPRESTPPPPTKTPEAKGKNIVEEPPNDVSAEEMEEIRLLDKADKVAEQKRLYEEMIRLKPNRWERAHRKRPLRLL